MPSRRILVLALLGFDSGLPLMGALKAETHGQDPGDLSTLAD